MSFVFLNHLDRELEADFLVKIEAISKDLPERERDGTAFLCTTMLNDRVHYSNIWLFSKNLAIRIREPRRRQTTQYEMAQFAGVVDWVRVTARGYEPNALNNDASLDVEFTTSEGWSGDLTAVGLECKYLMVAYHEHILPNFHPGSHS